MTLLANRVEINKYLGYNFDERCMTSVASARKKWEKRLKREPITMDTSVDDDKFSHQRRYMPKEVVEYTNLLTTLCPHCTGKVARASHLSSVHKKNVPTPCELWDMLLQIKVKQLKMTKRGACYKTNRRATTDLRGSIVDNYTKQIKSVLDMPPIVSQKD